VCVCVCVFVCVCVCVCVCVNISKIFTQLLITDQSFQWHYYSPPYSRTLIFTHNNFPVLMLYTITTATLKIAVLKENLRLLLQSASLRIDNFNAYS